MRSRLPNQEEPRADSQIEVETIPLGIRLTLQFLRLLLVVMVFPLLGAAVVATISLIAGATSPAPASQTMAFGLMGLGSFVVMLTLVTGTVWMECHLNQSPVSFVSHWKAGHPDHPARKLILPAVGSVAFYGYAAVLLWIAAHVGPDMGLNFGWPIMWSSLAAGATLLLRYLKAKLPE